MSMTQGRVSTFCSCSLVIAILMIVCIKEFMLWMAAFGTWILSLVGGSLLSGLAIRISRFGGQSEDSWLTVGGQSVDSQWTPGG